MLDLECHAEGWVVDEEGLLERGAHPQPQQLHQDAGAVQQVHTLYGRHGSDMVRGNPCMISALGRIAQKWTPHRRLHGLCTSEPNEDKGGGGLTV